jgi:hypothetical protein
MPVVAVGHDARVDFEQFLFHPFQQLRFFDGRSFRSQLLGKSRDPRRWIYGWYDGKYAWARNKYYKLYKTGLNGNRAGKFYDVINDDREVAALPEPLAGSRLEALKAEYQAVIDRMDLDNAPNTN